MGKNFNDRGRYSGNDLIHICEKSPVVKEIRQNGTSHAVVRTEKGSAVIPCHNEDLGVGIQCKLIKWMKAVGILVTFFTLVYYVYTLTN